MTNPKIVILGTGGTIAGQAESSTQAVGYKAGQISVESLLAAVPDLPQLAAAPLVAMQLAQIDSKDMDWQVWRSLLQTVAEALADADTQALVITHGTDTLEETAWLLQTVLQPVKPVVLTCAMRPATSLQADGPQNLRDAVAVAASAVAGVWVVAAGEVHGAQQVLKVHPYRLNALRSYESGPCAVVEECAVRWLAQPVATSQAQALSSTALQDLLACSELPWVELLTSGALQSGRSVDALVAAGVRGLVVAGTGNATIHAQMLQALARAQQAGVVVWSSTRCLEGLPVGFTELPSQPTVVKAVAGISGWLRAGATAGEPDVILLTPGKARVALMLALALQSGGDS
ncbi:asparaginase [Comamonas sp.]|uniref:asparaginase n=1 Tax=Comamonas sp. TaxID=34028 RepID=UPI003A95C123